MGSYDLLFSTEIQKIVDGALAEDLGQGDVTTEALVAPHLQARASVMAKERGVLAGIEVAALVFHRVDPSLTFKSLAGDGSRVEAGHVIAVLEGAATSILRAERVALNFLQRLSGIATDTARYVEAVAGLPARILDTRKTTPGLRLLERYAVQVAGGHNHRKNLGDGVLIKDNHLAALRSSSTDVTQAIKQARQKAPHTLKIEVEVQTVEEAYQAIEADADAILLDNMNLDDMRQAVNLARGRALTEASGGITLDNVRAVAETGVGLISIGALTHSSKALDISLELEPL